MLVAGGSTNVTLYFAMRLVADGTAATGLTITDFDLQYVRSGTAPSAKVDAIALAAVDSAHADNKGFEVDATDQPGLYRFDFPDAAFVAGVRQAICSVKVATAFTEHLRVEIDIIAEQVNNSLNVTTYSEPSQGAPPATITIRQMIHFLYKFWRNKKDQDGSLTQLYADDGSTVDQKATTSESGGTVTHEEFGSGP